MTFAIKAQGLAKEWEGKPLFQNVDFEIEDGHRVALFGRNGVGKTTLIRGLMNEIQFDRGTVWRRYPTANWGWLEQQLQLDEQTTLLSFVGSGRPEMEELRRRLLALQQEMDGMGDDDGGSERIDTESWGQLTALYGSVQEQYLIKDGYGWEVSVEQMLTRFGFSAGQFGVPYGTLSGGEKTRAQLARLLVSDPALLVLDEPTNHLDTETLSWLENWLKGYKGTVLFVSHDRSFIDSIAHAVLELTPDGARRYEGGYASYQSQRDAEIRSQQALYDKQQREKQHLVEAIRQYRQWYKQAHDAAGIDFYKRKKAEKNSTRFKAKERALERLEAEMVERPKLDPSLRIQFRDGSFEAKTLVNLHDVTFRYGDAPLFEGLCLRVQRGDKMAVVGRNGIGKSTLLKLLTSQLQPLEGLVEHHPEIRIGYFAQELDDLNLSQTVLDTLLSMDGMTQSYARTVLAGFLFPKEDVMKRVRDLSMGERCRVAFVKLYFSGANLLVLDEPTNYLDVDARERIEDALESYPGALLMVSHDRYLIRRVANRIVNVKAVSQGSGSTVEVFNGPYEEWISQSAEDSNPVDVRNQIRQLEYQLSQAIATDTPRDPDEQRQLMADIRRLQDELQALRGVK